MIIDIFCYADDFCKFYREKLSQRFLPSKKKGNRASKMSLSEIIAISVYYHLSGYKTFKDYYTKGIQGEFKDCFPKLVSYNRFLELRKEAAFPIAIFSIMINSAKCTGISFIDSFPLPVCHNKRISSHKTFKGVAQRGKTSMGWFYGFKLHVSINHHGEITAFHLTSGNVHDSDEIVIKGLTKKLFGMLFGDKGYLGKRLFDILWEKGVKIITKVRKNMKKKAMSCKEKFLLKKRGVVESVGNILKNNLSINHSRHRSVAGFFVNLCSGLIAYAFKKNKPSIEVSEMFIDIKI